MSAESQPLAAQEKPDLFEESIGSRLMLQEQMVLALEGDEVSARNASSQLAARLDWNNEITPHMHYDCRYLDFREEVGDIQIASDIESSGSALGRGSSALQFVENICLLVRCPWNELPRKQ